MNEVKLHEIIDWYIKECNGKLNEHEGIIERNEKIKYFQSINKEQILNFTIEELSEYLKKLWSVLPLSIPKIINKNGLENFKERLLDLLYGDSPINERWDNFHDNIVEFKATAMSEILSYIYPDNFVIWNAKSQFIFDVLEVDDLPKYNDNLNYELYSKLVEKGRVIQQELSKKLGEYQQLIFVDYMFFLYYINEMRKKELPQLNEIINSYMLNFEKHRERELYKWKVIKVFQDNWDIEAKDFSNMLKTALKPAKQLLDSQNNFPQGTIITFAEKEPETVRKMFKILFNEEIELKARIEDFINNCDSLLEKHYEGNRNHYQTAHVISIYLTMKYPDKYYFYKPNAAKKMSNLLKYDIKADSIYKKLIKYNKFCDFILEYIEQNQNLLTISADSLDESCFKDENHHMLLFDLMYYYNTYYENMQEETGEEKMNDTNYFWLNTNPRTQNFSFRDLNVFESQEFTNLSENGNKRQHFDIAKSGDKIIVYETTPVLKVIGLAEVSNKTENGFLNIRLTHKLANPIAYETIKQELSNASFIKNPNGTLLKLLKQEYDIIVNLIKEQNELDDYSYSWEKMSEKSFLEYDQYKDIVRLLKDKQNIIIEGAPGVGKTYIAEKIIYTLQGNKSNDRIEFVQFHQSYSYEDFVRGYRPTKDGGFELKDGIFLKFCEKARKDKEPHYLIIDEINRGNLSKIFGELLMLIEKDKREKYSVKLAYSKEDEENFSIPKNLYIIGLMNTADRSLALMDYALRRRFAFYPINPLFNEKFDKYVDSFNNPTFKKVIDAVKELNIKIYDDDSLGEGFMIGHSYFCNLEEVDNEKLEDIINYEIKPLLREYWYDKKEKAEEEIKNLLGILKND